MTKPAVTDATTVSLAGAAELMWREQTGSLVIVEAGKIVGIITERDVLRTVAAGKDLTTITVGAVMSPEVVTTTSGAPLRDAARTMARHWIRHLPVVDGGTLVGMISQRDITGVFASLVPGNGTPEIETDLLVRDQRLARIGHGDLD